MPNIIEFKQFILIILCNLSLKNSFTIQTFLGTQRTMYKCRFNGHYIISLNLFFYWTQLAYMETQFISQPGKFSATWATVFNLTLPCSCSNSCRASTPLLPEGPAPSSDTDSPSRSREDTELERFEGPREMFQLWVSFLILVSHHATFHALITDNRLRCFHLFVFIKVFLILHLYLKNINAL